MPKPPANRTRGANMHSLFGAFDVAIHTFERNIATVARSLGDAELRAMREGIEGLSPTNCGAGLYKTKDVVRSSVEAELTMRKITAGPHAK